MAAIQPIQPQGAIDVTNPSPQPQTRKHTLFLTTSSTSHKAAQEPEPECNKGQKIDASDANSPQTSSSKVARSDRAT